jgi:hypothetical protein
MVNGHQMVISLMAAAFLSKTISSRLGPELYQELANGWIAAAPPARSTAQESRAI